MTAGQIGSESLPDNFDITAITHMLARTHLPVRPAGFKSGDEAETLRLSGAFLAPEQQEHACSVENENR